MFLGSECHHPACHLHDFLPFSCPACHQSFCQPHFLPSHHSCTSPLPKSMQDRIAPQCPLCDSVVTSTPSGDPNEAVERHINSGTCAGLEGGEARRKALLKQKKDRGEVCWRRGCAKTLVVQMKCESCTHVFCPTHRSAASHSCSNTSTPGSSRGGTPQPQAKPAPASSSKNPMARFTSSSSKPSQPPASSPNTSSSPRPIAAALDAKSAAAAAALKRAGQDAKVPFVKTKTEKRAKDEEQSALRAMKVRHDKGLLSKDEEVRYRTMVAGH